MKVLMVGPFPKPIHGMSLSNDSLYQTIIEDDDFDVTHKFDTVFDRVLKDKRTQGRFDFVYSLRSISNMFRCLYSVLTIKYDVIYITPGQSVLGFIRFFPILLVSKILRNRVVIHIHGSRLIRNFQSSSFIYNIIFKMMVCSTCRFIFLSESIAKDANKMIPIEKINVCMNGIQLPIDIVPTTNSPTVNVLFLSNLMKDKGVLDLFEMIENHQLANYEFNFAGDIEQGTIECCRSFFERNINCVYHGVVSGEKKSELFKNADIFVLPSYDEGVPLSILEAYSYGCAVITTPVGGVKDIFSDDINGYFCEVNNPQSIYTSLLKVVDDLEVIKNNNRQEAIDKYSLLKFYKRVKNVLISRC
ncbi:Gt2 [Vibrio chagasii]|nr:Gt2 [Vibrio chagasii]